MSRNILNYLFILSVVSRAQETLTDEERGERLRKGLIVFMVGRKGWIPGHD